MATNYPGSLDSFTNPAALDALNDPAVPHASQHSDLNDAVTAIETALGANPAGSALALDISQVTADIANVLTAGTGPGEVDTTGTPVWYKFTIDGTDYGVAGYPLNV